MNYFSRCGAEGYGITEKFGLFWFDTEVRELGRNLSTCFSNAFMSAK